MTKQIKSNNGELVLALLKTMKGNYTLKLTVQNKGSGCLRSSTEDARFIYQWATLGTKVVVVP
jgi:hypothetical protein